MALQVTPSGSSTSIFIYPVIHDLLCSTWGNIFNFSIVSNHLFSEFQCVTICFGNITGIKIGKIKNKIISILQTKSDIHMYKNCWNVNWKCYMHNITRILIWILQCKIRISRKEADKFQYRFAWNKYFFCLQNYLK